MVAGENQPAKVEDDYLARLHADVPGWYRGADAKAQPLRTLDGVLVTVTAAVVFTKPDEVAAAAFHDSVRDTLIFAAADAALSAACVWSAARLRGRG
jgi:hypothetical protein